MAIKSLEDLDLAGKRVLVRVDFNVSLDKKTKAISDDTRVVKSLPTIEYLIGSGAKVILCSHFGRPDGAPDPEYSLKKVADCLAVHLGRPVAFVGDCIGDAVRQAVEGLKDGQVLVLENLRFHKGETKNDDEFARQLAALADVYVDDAFGAAHRAHASVFGVPKLIKAKAAGKLLQTEIQYLSGVVKKPESPFVVILGGAKISGKLEVIRNLLPLCDSMLIGGGMAYTFLKAKGWPIGKSLVEEDLVGTAKDLLTLAQNLNKTFLLPCDHVVAGECKAEAPSKVVEGDKIPAEMMALDIGPKTVDRFAKEILKAKTIVWNGPLGVFEMKPFHKGTFQIAKAIADSKALSVVGGGESVAAVNQAGVADRITHISTGGGASLEFLEGKVLPGVAALES